VFAQHGPHADREIRTLLHHEFLTVVWSLPSLSIGVVQRNAYEVRQSDWSVHGMASFDVRGYFFLRVGINKYFLSALCIGPSVRKY
jgi:hypothetical protein